ncbi:hypothetical protein PYW08_007481 [Mythimna loreyi]|uniref:Uncharacterized protein n=1 Tax=Mythimna loreyi TaxID=667449 RepID=A0ACC2QCV7_9NEOP|nr:hypothetical protein PYW08_007481 [Mythimna loreyi]
MIRTLVILCLAASAFSLFDSDWKKGLKVRYDLNLLEKALGKSFIDLPQSKDDAVAKKWKEETSKPDLHEGFESLEVWGHEKYRLCLLFDDTGYIAGILIAFNTEEISDTLYDFTTQGFKSWTRTDKDGDSVEYWFTALYFSSPEYLQISAEDRIDSRNSKRLLQDDYIYVSGINGKLHPISTDVKQIADTATSNFTLQACMPWMGTHYYYQMTEELECNDQLFPWFPLVDDKQLLGIGFVTYMKMNLQKDIISTCEKPPKAAVKFIVPRGPKCLYDLADNPGLVTQHTYFVDSPTSILCLPKLG